MNKINKMILAQARKIVFKQIQDILTEEIKNCEKSETKEFIDIFNSGIIIDSKKIKIYGLKYVDNILKKKPGKRTEKE